MRRQDRVFVKYRSRQANAEYLLEYYAPRAAITWADSARNFPPAGVNFPPAGVNFPPAGE